MFDAFLIVDWSASSVPKRNADSIWIGYRAASQAFEENPATRLAAERRIGELLDSGKRTLAGFDFSLGYPAGLADRLGRSGWRGLWAELADRIEDDATNQNNRFAVAAEWNRRASGGRGPFWGCPPRRQGRYLGSRKSDADFAGIPELRICEARQRGPQSAFKLLGAGSVGSQVLLGIPVLERLRFRSSARNALLVWPFETGLQPPTGSVLAEVYPSLLPLEPSAGEVKDQAQVRALARFFHEADRAGTLEELFRGPSDLSAAERRTVESEEGWILGVR